MTMDERIARINELYHKSQGVGLTPEEKEEQQRLRREYVDSIKRNMKAQLDNIDIVEKDGSITNLGEKYSKK
jgi:5-formyltetrahydrofolate cyclo-ligase